MLIIVIIIVLYIYIRCPLIGKVALLLANSFIPDPIPFIDEFIMWIGLFAHISQFLHIAKFVSNHKILFVILFLIFLALVFWGIYALITVIAS